MSEADWKVAWDLFDRPPRKGVLPKSVVKDCMRGIGEGRYYGETALDELLSGYPEPMGYQDFVDAMKKPYEPPPVTTRAACQAYDGKEVGMLMEMEVMKMLTGDGADALPDQLLEAARYGLVFQKGEATIDELERVYEMPASAIEPTLDDVLKYAV